jgi:hypothetical protein
MKLQILNQRNLWPFNYGIDMRDDGAEVVRLDGVRIDKFEKVRMAQLLKPT